MACTVFIHSNINLAAPKPSCRARQTSLPLGLRGDLSSREMTNEPHSERQGIRLLSQRGGGLVTTRLGKAKPCQVENKDLQACRAVVLPTPPPGGRDLPGEERRQDLTHTYTLLHTPRHTHTRVSGVAPAYSLLCCTVLLLCCATAASQGFLKNGTQRQWPGR